MTRESDHCPRAAKQFLFETADSKKNSVEESLRPRWTSRNVNVHMQDLADASKRRVVLAEDTATDAAGANGHHDSRFWHSLVGLQQGKLHVPGDGTGHQEHIGMTRRCDELNSEAFNVMDWVVQGDDFHLAPIA